MPLSDLSSNIVRSPREDSPETVKQEDDSRLDSASTNWVPGIQHDWLSQLQYFSANDNVHGFADTTEYTDYDSDRTDFLLIDTDIRTPCPTRTVNQQSPTASFYSKRTAKQKKKKSVVRRSDFGGTKNETPLSTIEAKSKIKHTPRSKPPPKPESSPRHPWTRSEHRILSVLWRFYIPNAKEFTKVFNHLLALDLSTRKVQARFESYMMLHGPKAFPKHDYEHVYQCVSLLLLF